MGQGLQMNHPFSPYDAWYCPVPLNIETFLSNDTYLCNELSEEIWIHPSIFPPSIVFIWSNNTINNNKHLNNVKDLNNHKNKTSWSTRREHLRSERHIWTLSLPNVVQILDISTSKSALNPTGFQDFDFQMCLSPQPRAFFLHVQNIFTS